MRALPLMLLLACRDEDDPRVPRDADADADADADTDADADSDADADVPAGRLAWAAPREGEVLDGQAILWVDVSADTAPADRAIDFEASTDGGVTWSPVDRFNAPELSPETTRTVSIDLGLYPTGPLQLRTRFTDETDGPIRTIEVGVPPFVDCQLIDSWAVGPNLTNVSYDCRTGDADGTVASATIAFGDGTSAPISPFVVHTYDGPGPFDVLADVVDDDGLRAVWQRRVEVVDPTIGRAVSSEATTCGCQSMRVIRTGDGHLPDRDRGEIDDLGPDPRRGTFDFEIEATLVPGSDPDLCIEGQSVRGSSTYNDRPLTGRKKCTSPFPPRSECTTDAECVSLFCVGGTHDGLVIGWHVSRSACVDAGGSVDPIDDVPGKCEEVPDGGTVRGDDAYHLVSTVKQHLPHGGGDPAPFLGVRWYDSPGLKEYDDAGAWQDGHSVSDRDFLAFVDGPSLDRCLCHFTVHVDWSGDDGHVGSELRVLADESVNCVPD